MGFTDIMVIYTEEKWDQVPPCAMSDEFGVWLFKNAWCYELEDFVH